jgi:hypothetical protein
MRDSLIGQLVGEQLGAVVFVQDYLQLDFDGKRLTVNVWPRVVVEGIEFEFEKTGYRDTLCALIGETVVSAHEAESEILVAFEDGYVAFDLAKDIGVERLIFENVTTKEWQWW